MSNSIRLMGIAVAVAGLLLAACGGEPVPEGGSDPTATVKPAELTEAQREAGKLIKGMVAAVKTDTRPSLVNVKFELQSRPEIDQPLKVDLAFLPLVPGKALGATFVAGQGLKIPPDQTPAQFDSIEVGAAYPYQLTVVPSENGVLYFSAVIQLEGPGEPRMQSFSIPVVVGPPPTAR